MMLHDQDESVPSAQARELAWQGGDSGASVYYAEQQRLEEPSLTSP